MQIKNTTIINATLTPRKSNYSKWQRFIKLYNYTLSFIEIHPKFINHTESFLPKKAIFH